MPQLKYRCLIVDFDDTLVNSTGPIHYPSYVEGMKRLRPDLVPETLEGWFKVNHNPGVMEYFNRVYTEEQRKIEAQMWKDTLAKAELPAFYPGILDIILEFQKSGGFVAIVSHNKDDFIARTFEAQGHGVKPDIILGWRDEKEMRKPAPGPALEVMRQLGVSAAECIMIDDLSPGLIMAKAVSIQCCLAAWEHSTMESEVDADTPILRNVAELRSHLFIE